MRKLFLMSVVLFVSLSIAGCAGSSKEPEVVEKGSLNRTYKLIDDSGRESGTLVLKPAGGAELRDQDGKVIGTFNPGGSTSEPVAEKAVEPVEKKATETVEGEKESDEEKTTD
jgi:hypothetical protein